MLVNAGGDDLPTNQRDRRHERRMEDSLVRANALAHDLQVESTQDEGFSGMQFDSSDEDEGSSAKFNGVGYEYSDDEGREEDDGEHWSETEEDEPEFSEEEDEYGFSKRLGNY